jgi:hypothetical protein
VVDVVLERHVAADVAAGEDPAGLGGGDDPEACVIHLIASVPTHEQRICQAGHRRRAAIGAPWF